MTKRVNRHQEGSVVYEKKFVKNFIPDLTKDLIHNRGLVLKAGNLYKFKIDPAILLSINIYKEEKFKNKHYNEIYLKNIRNTNTLREIQNNFFSGENKHIMFLGNIVTQTRVRSNTKPIHYVGFLFGDQILYIDERTFWEQGFVELD